jgi:flagellar protein FlaF
MHKTHYADMLEDGAAQARQRERMALDRSISLMQGAARADSGPADAAAAISFTARLWTVLIEDLAAPDNGLPKELRAQLVSIGIWILRELEAMRSGSQTSFAGLIEVSAAIRDGLT